MAKILTKSDSQTGVREKLQKAVTAKHGSGGDYSYDDPQVQDVFPDKVVHTKPGKAHRGKLFATAYTMDGGDVKLGAESEVEPAYKPLSETATRGLVAEAAAFDEATGSAYNAKTKTLNITIIKPGFNTSKSRYYPSSTLKRDGNIFEGAKMFMNHQTKAEAAARPEGRVQDWAATITKVNPFSETAGLTGKAKVHHKGMQEQLESLQEAGLLSEMGVSIRAAGLQSEVIMAGVKTNLVESFAACKSVDFVTFPGAGGKVDLLESDTSHFMSFDELETAMQESDENDVDLISVEALAARRPDFVEALKIELKESVTMEKTVTELQAELKTAQEAKTTAESKLKLAEEATQKATVKVELTKLLSESGLPDASKTKLTKQLEESTDVAAIKPAIESEAEYLKSLGVSLTPAKKVTKMGESQESGDTDIKAKRENYIKAQMGAGMTKDMAEASATDLMGSV